MNDDVVRSKDRRPPRPFVATWNINASWPGALVLTATPNRGGDTGGVTIKTNGSPTRPTVSRNPS